MTVGDYASLNEFKRDINTPLTQTRDDDIIESIITQASREIDVYCSRHFYGIEQTRIFDALNNVVGYNELLLDEDLAGVIEIVTGDGTILDPSEYVLLPANDFPKATIKILASSSKWWAYQIDPENAISVNGTWGFVAGTVPPEPVKRACLMLSRWRYEQRRAPFETQGQGDLTTITIPSGMPENIKQLLLAYRKPYMRSAGW